MSDNVNFNRDKFVLDLLIKRYEEQERKVGIVDNKISNMIALIGTLLTVQGPIFTFFLSSFMEKDSSIIRIVFFSLLLILIIIVLGYYAYSMKKFINAYHFKKFKAIPNHVTLVSWIENEEYGEYDLICDLIGTVEDTIEHNTKEIKNKVEAAKYGFLFFECAGIFSIAFALLFPIIIMVV